MPVPKVGPNQVLIKVDSCALNPSDIYFLKGMYKVKLNYPYTPGWEGAGTVVAVGSGLASSWLIGKRVSFMKQFEVGEYHIGGSFADYCLTNFQHVMPLSDDTTLEEGASNYVNPLTALGMVKRCKELKA